MSTGPHPGPRIELEVFSTALGAGLVAGALSLLAPELVALSGTLAALAFAGWCSLVAEARAIGKAIGRPGPLFALAVAGAGALLYAFPGPFGAYRGIAVVLALVPLWRLGRPAPPPYSVAGAGL